MPTTQHTQKNAPSKYIFVGSWAENFDRSTKTMFLLLSRMEYVMGSLIEPGGIYLNIRPPPCNRLTHMWWVCSVAPRRRCRRTLNGGFFRASKEHAYYITHIERCPFKICVFFHRKKEGILPHKHHSVAFKNENMPVEWKAVFREECVLVSFSSLKFLVKSQSIYWDLWICDSWTAQCLWVSGEICLPSRKEDKDWPEFGVHLNISFKIVTFFRTVTVFW